MAELFSCFRVLVLCMLAHCHGLLGHLNRTEPSLLLLGTLVIFLLCVAVKGDCCEKARPQTSQGKKGFWENILLSLSVKFNWHSTVARIASVPVPSHWFFYVYMLCCMALECLYFYVFILFSPVFVRGVLTQNLVLATSFFYLTLSLRGANSEIKLYLLFKSPKS